MEFSTINILQLFIIIILTVVGWGVRGIWSTIKGFDTKLDHLRAEIKEELKESLRQETCRAHREAIEKQFIELRMAQRKKPLPPEED